MLHGAIIPGVLTIAIPIMIMNVLQSLFNIVDMTILKQSGASSAVGAVGVCGSLITLITGLLTGISSGANVVIAKSIGKGDKESVERSVGTSLMVAFFGGVILLVIGVTFAEVFLGWMNCPDTLLADAALYFRLYFIGVPILMVYSFAAAILRSTGDSQRPMIYSLAGGAVKVALTYFFVAVCNLAVTGVGLATIISWLVTAIPSIVALYKTDGITKINPKKLRFYKAELLEMLYIGIPAGLQMALYSIANVVITTTVNGFGEYATTGISIANNFDGILYQISTAPALAVVSYVSQNIGAGNVKRAERSILSGMLVTVVLGGGLGALSAIFSGQLSSIMSDVPEVIAFSQQKMIIISSTYFISGINESMNAALRGMRKPIIPAVSTLMFMCALRFVWVYLIFPLCPNLTFLYFVWPIGWVLCIATSLIFYFPEMRRLKHVHHYVKSPADPVSH